MGTDITCFIEFSEPGNRGSDYFTPFAEVFLPRDYALFAALAGVRGDATPLFWPRGLPSNVSATVAERYYVWVVDPLSEEEWKGDSFITRAEAERLHQGGLQYESDARDRIAHPDWFGASWLTPGEVRDALKYAEVALASCSREFALALRASEELHEKSPSGSRFVFWFSS